MAKPKFDSPAEKFFYEHGGYSYDPKKETAEQGRRRTARQLAAAEKLAGGLDWEFIWEEDPEPYELGTEEEEMPDEVLMLSLKNEDGEIVDSLGSIGFAGPQAERRNQGRVFEAQMALEYASERGLI